MERQEATNMNWELEKLKDDLNYIKVLKLKLHDLALFPETVQKHIILISR